ncbi:hypothetical protein Y1Q_0012505 [Alligator mississippiensis]|uniref:Uncharacterized protein n=1 Tax=Alligator mississippiensis TaxID=8496 RepID=A0A151M7V7_ALLMI|nr:hypothetical protein Y1Q_0012505 [Alligator mississippiensis]
MRITPGEYVRKATPVRMTCMHGHSTYYPRRVYQVTVLKTTREMPVGVARDLQYLMILGRDWREIYEVLHIVREDRMGEGDPFGSKEDAPAIESFEVEGLSNSKAFRRAQAEEHEFQAIIETKLVKEKEDVVNPRHYANLPRFRLGEGCYIG